MGSEVKSKQSGQERRDDDEGEAGLKRDEEKWGWKGSDKDAGS